MNKLLELNKDIIRQDLKENPVYMGLLDVFESIRTPSVNDNKAMAVCMLLSFLDRSMIADPETEKWISLRSGDGSSVQHQIIDFVTDDSLNGTVVGELPSDRFNEHAMGMIYGLSSHNGMPHQDSFVEFAGNLLPIPNQRCAFSRLTPKAVDYLVELGVPSVDTIDAFRHEMDIVSEQCDNKMYEEIILCVMGGKQRAFYWCYKNGVFIGYRYTKNDEAVERSWFTVSSWRPEANSYYDNEERHGQDDIFDIRAFIVNLWAAKSSRQFREESEPQETRKYVGAICAPYKPNYSNYRYVKITPEAEANLNEAKRVILSARKDAEYLKSVWFTRGYFARRGSDKRIVYCSASIHHRKCADVIDKSKVTVYT